MDRVLANACQTLVLAIRAGHPAPRKAADELYGCNGGDEDIEFQLKTLEELLLAIEQEAGSE